MRSTLLTKIISYGILAVYLIYGLSSMPFIGILLSMAIGLLAFGTTESTETAVAISIIVGIFYTLVYKSGSVPVKEGFNTDSSEQIVQRIADIKREVKGVYSSSFVEGFANVDTDGSGNQVSSDTTSAESKPANASGSGEAGSGITPPSPPAAAQATTQATTQGFKGDSGTNKQFKLGVIPSDEKGGYHIDQGTTIINALNALKPDQIQAMTQDTQKLIETQKSLMSMLGTMKPMLQDGKQMMVNFQEMFGNGGMKI